MSVLDRWIVFGQLRRGFKYPPYVVALLGGPDGVALSDFNRRHFTNGHAYVVCVDPGERARLLMLAAKRLSVASAIQAAEALSLLPPAALEGLDLDTRAEIINW